VSNPVVVFDDFSTAHKAWDEASFIGRFPHGFLVLRSIVIGKAGLDFHTAVFDPKMLGESMTERILIPLLKRGELLAFAKITVGRTQNNDIVLDAGSISKFHAFFRIERDGYSLIDAGSTNGTIVDGRPLRKLEPKRLEPGAAITFGDSFSAVFHDACSLHRAMNGTT
jgi:hypothetical protein